MDAVAATKGDSTSADGETNGGSRGKEGGPSLNSLAIMRKATTPTHISSVGVKDWRHIVYEGVLLENNTQKFWVDKKLHKNCFLVVPRPTDSEWLINEQHWTWIPVKEKCFGGLVDIRVPDLKKLSWLEVGGKFKTSALSPKTEYEVAYVVKLKRNNDYPWPLPVNLELDVPNRPKQIRMENMDEKPKEKWLKFRVGEFRLGPETVGTIVFNLHETCQIFKSGLIVKGVSIHPKA